MSYADSADPCCDLCATKFRTRILYSLHCRNVPAVVLIGGKPKEPTMSVTTINVPSEGGRFSHIFSKMRRAFEARKIERTTSILRACLIMS